MIDLAFEAWELHALHDFTIASSIQASPGVVACRLAERRSAMQPSLARSRTKKLDMLAPGHRTASTSLLVRAAEQGDTRTVLELLEGDEAFDPKAVGIAASSGSIEMLTADRKSVV